MGMDSLFHKPLTHSLLWHMTGFVRDPGSARDDDPMTRMTRADGAYRGVR